MQCHMFYDVSLVSADEARESLQKKLFHVQSQEINQLIDQQQFLIVA